jgi:transcriptional regulator with XRE-family HTH domain
MCDAEYRIIMENPFSIAKRLEALMKERGVTNYKLAEVVDITIGQVSRLKNGSTPSVPTLKRIADFFGTTMDDMLDDPLASAAPGALEAGLIEAAQRAQKGDPGALAEMRKLAARLGVAEAARVKSSGHSAKHARKKSGT